MMIQTNEIQRMKPVRKQRLFSEVAEADLVRIFIENLQLRKEEEKQELENLNGPIIKIEFHRNQN